MFDLAAGAQVLRTKDAESGLVVLFFFWDDYRK
jgi:hypothetical protein